MSEPTPVKKIIDAKSDMLKSESVVTEIAIHCDTCGKDTHLTKDHGKNGGVRKGAGKPKGKLLPKTLEKQKVNDAYNELTMRAATKLFNAQFGLATGMNQLYVKRRIGRGKDRRTEVEIVSDQETIKEYLIDDGLTLNQEGEDEYYYLTTKPADNKAIDSLLNRALGKAPDKLEITGGFFSQSQLTIKVVGSDHDTIDIGEDGQLSDGGSTSADPIGETGPSSQDSQPPASS